jgi:NAD(P)-dependent dehydrogenase (short-subunit alcohol dehydrogenase family)
MPVDFSLTDKVAVITGASRGIGEAIARTFAKNGAKVVISSRKQDACDKVAASIKEDGGEAMAQACHTGKMDQIEALYEKVLDAWGTVDILVNNAATNPYFGDLLNISESQYDKTFDVNTKGYFFMAQKACKIMMEKKSGGSIVNISSIAGIKAPPMQGTYGMTKAAVILMTKALAAELGPFGIRVNAICPGLTDTYFSSVLIKTKPIYDAAMTMIPLKRHAQPDEMAGAALYLASEASSFTTGSVIVCDGGAVA